MDPKIKPCPFCGGAPEVRHHAGDTYDIKCAVCWARSGLYYSEQEAAAAWNTRVPNLDTKGGES